MKRFNIHIIERKYNSNELLFFNKKNTNIDDLIKLLNQKFCFEKKFVILGCPYILIDNI